METLPITLGQMQAVEALRSKYENNLSSHAFNSLYLWREQMGLSLLLTPDFYTVRCNWRGRNSWFFPCGEEEASLGFIREKMRESDFSLCYLRTCDADWLEKKLPGRWRLSRYPEADEYLYDTDGHITLAGGNYANMRTQVHKVEREYVPRSAQLCDDNIHEALEIVRQWSHGHCRFSSSDLRDDRVDEEALILRKELGITGIVLYLDDKPVSVTAGFPLGKDLYDMAVAKSVSVAQGVPYYAKRELFRKLSFHTINMEEDLGIPGLRRMKNGMSPIAKNEIWEANLL